MKLSTKVFFGLLSALLLNVAFSLSLTFTVPPGVNPFDWFLQAPVQLGMFIATGVVVMILDFYLLFGGIGRVELLPPYTPSAVFGFMSPLLFLSLFFVQRPANATITFFDILPMTFITIMFYLVLTIINSITENVHAVKTKSIRI
jgi:hypothetical protein